MKSMTKQEAMAALRGKCVALIRVDDFETAKAVAHAVAEAGIGAIEVTFTVKDAPRLIRELNMQSVRVGRRVDGHRLNPHFMTGADNAHGNLAPVGDQNF